MTEEHLKKIEAIGRIKSPLMERSSTVKTVFMAGADAAWPVAEAAGIRKIITALRREATLFGTGTAHNAQDVADWLESKFAAELEGK